jgi:hypothetical protein
MRSCELSRRCAGKQADPKERGYCSKAHVNRWSGAPEHKAGDNDHGHAQSGCNPTLPTHWPPAPADSFRPKPRMLRYHSASPLASQFSITFTISPISWRGECIPARQSSCKSDGILDTGRQAGIFNPHPLSTKAPLERDSLDDLPLRVRRASNPRPNSATPNEVTYAKFSTPDRGRLLEG